MRILGTALSIVASMALAIMPIAEAKAMTVQPVVVNLTSQGSGMSQVVKVENTFATRLPVELQIEELRFDGETLVNTHADPGDLLVFPPQAFIEPGQTQTFRIQYVGDPELAKSKLKGTPYEGGKNWPDVTLVLRPIGPTGKVVGEVLQQRVDHRAADVRQQHEDELHHHPGEPDGQQGQQAGEEESLQAGTRVGVTRGRGHARIVGAGARGIGAAPCCGSRGRRPGVAAAPPGYCISRTRRKPTSS